MKNYFSFAKERASKDSVLLLSVPWLSRPLDKGTSSSEKGKERGSARELCAISGTFTDEFSIC